jgi:hypothetical protein
MVDNVLERAFALRFLARQLARPADRLSLFTGFLHRRFFEMLPKLHFTENAFTLQLLLQSTERLIDIVIPNHYLHL